MGDLSADWGKTRIMAHVNRTQVTGVLSVSRDKRDIDVFGCGLHHTIAMAPKDARRRMWCLPISLKLSRR
jgi:hypothetical protein